MGLAVEVGLLAALFLDDPEGAEWARETITKVNEVLAEKDLPQHIEPEQLPPLCTRAPILSTQARYHARWSQAVRCSGEKNQ